MSTTALHLLVLNAHAPSARPRPALEALLRRLAPGPRQLVPEDAPETAPERALALALGLATDPAQAAPWAALQAHAWGLPAAGRSAWGWLSLCHWQVGMDHVFMHEPEALALEAAEAQALRAAIEPLLAEDGLTLHEPPTARPEARVVPAAWRAALDAVRPRGVCWLVEGEALRGRRLASVARAAGADVRPWLPRERRDPLARLLSELQMQLYAHPVNDARAARRQPLANAVWFSAAGSLEAPPEPRPLQIDATLAQASVTGAERAPARDEAWAQLDRGPLAQLAAAAARGEPVTLTLCGAQAFQTWGPQRRGLGQRISRFFGRTPASNGLLSL